MQAHGKPGIGRLRTGYLGTIGKLTDAQIRKAKKADKAHRLSAGVGLHLEISAAGGKL